MDDTVAQIQDNARLIDDIADCLLEALEKAERLCAERGEAFAIKPTHLIYVGGQGLTREEFQEKAQKLIAEDCQE